MTVPGFGPLPYMERALRGEYCPSDEMVARARASWDYSLSEAWNQALGIEGPDRPAISGSRQHNCARRLAAWMAGIPEDERDNPRMNWNFIKGRIGEAINRAWSLLGGLPDVLSPLPSGEEVRYRYRIGGAEYGDSPDLVWREDGALVVADFKATGNSYAVKKIRDGAGVPWEMDYDGQLHRHMAAVSNTLGEPCTRAYYVVVDMGTGQYAQTRLDWDGVLWARMEANVTAARGVGGGDPWSTLPRPEWAVTKEIAGCHQIDSVPCSYCGFKSRCWPGYEMTVVGGKPTWRKPK